MTSTSSGYHCSVVATPLASRGYLWHYTTWKSLERILVCPRHLWASHIAYLNDAEELRYAFELFRKVFCRVATKRQDEGNSLISEHSQRLLQREEVEGAVDAYVASFSEEANSLSQWRAYGAPGIPVAIGFDRRLLEAVAAESRFDLKHCVYEEEAQMSMLEPIARQYEERSLSYQGPDDPYGSTANRMAYYGALNILLSAVVPIAPQLKHRDFRDEKEIRLVRIQTKAAGSPALKLGFQVKDTIMVPHLEVPLEPRGLPLPIRAITIGPTPHQKLVIDATKLLLSDHSLRDVDVDGSTTPYRKL